MDYVKEYEAWKQERIKLILSQFKGYKCGMVLALDTTVYHNEPFKDRVDQFLSLKTYKDTTVIWANPVAINDQEIQVQQLYVPYSDDGLEALKIARRTLSLMCYMTRGIPILEKHNAGGPYPGIPMAGDRFRWPSLNGFDFKLLFQAVDISSITEGCWIALAYFRLAANATNEYYKFLSYHQVIGASFNNDSRAANKWIDSQIGNTELNAWIRSLPPGRKISSRLHETRALCAHVANSDDGKPSVVTDPDDVKSVRQVQTDLGAVRAFAKSRLSSYRPIARL